MKSRLLKELFLQMAVQYIIAKIDNGKVLNVEGLRVRLHAEAEKLERVTIRILGLRIKVGVKKADRDVLHGLISQIDATFVDDAIVQLVRMVMHPDDVKAS